MALAALFPRIIRPSSIWLTINSLSFELHEGHNMAATTVSVGHTISCAISYLDQNGNPMLVAQTPDSPPAWTNTTPATETIAPSADGLTCVATPVAAGTDTISLALKVGGTAYSASLAVTVQAAPQVLTSVAIVPTVN